MIECIKKLFKKSELDKRIEKLEISKAVLEEKAYLSPELNIERFRVTTQLYKTKEWKKMKPSRG